MTYRCAKIPIVVVVSALWASGCNGPSPPQASGVTAPMGSADLVSPAAEVTVVPAVGVVVPDEELTDQDGKPVRLRELMKDKVVAVNFVFTTCTTICSPMTAVFANVQAKLGEAMERDARLISISIDPATDTPERLRRYADRFERRPGWTFLTGKSDVVNRVLDALGGRAPVKESHAPITLIGRSAAGRWTRVYGIAPPARLAGEIRAFLAPSVGRGSGAGD